MKKVYPALIAATESGGYVVRVPDVSGCMTTGKNLEDAFDNIRDALAACLCTLEDVCESIPVPSSPAAVAQEGYTVILVSIDTIAYRKETDVKSVRKNVSMPAWMSYMADSLGINCSQILQDALLKKLEANA